MRLFYHGRDDNVRRLAAYSDSRFWNWRALPAVLICIPTEAGQIRQSFSPAPQVQILFILTTIKEGGVTTFFYCWSGRQRSPLGDSLRLALLEMGGALLS